MIAVVLAALSGMAYGAADFSGAMASKRANPMVVTVAMQVVSLVTLNAVLVVIPEDDRRWEDLAWAGLGGLGIAVALSCFYKALAIGPMSTAAALTALVGTVLPVAVGLGLGEQLSTLTLVGVAGCIPASVMVSAGSFGGDGTAWALTPRERLISRQQLGHTRRLSVIAGVGFGVFFVALSRVSGDAGLFPLLGARAASIVALAAVLTARRAWGPVGRAGWPAVLAAGALDCAANAFYLLAVSRGQLSWVAAVTSLYPVSTVLLARAVLKERMTRMQATGLITSVAALALVTAGR